MPIADAGKSEETARHVQAMKLPPAPLLGPDEPAPAQISNPQGRSPFLLVGDHAGNLIPRALDGLGVAPTDRDRHIGWDIGVAQLGRRLAARLDAVFIEQAYSRLVIDCNRAPGTADSIVCRSDGTRVPGNQELSTVAVAGRIAAIHAPYHAAIAAEIARRAACGQSTALIALHSFTPALSGVARPWEIGVLHDRGNARFARTLLGVLQKLPDLTVGDNQPYQMDGTDFTVPFHAYVAGIDYAELEIRQDCLADAVAVETWCDILQLALVTSF
jgi:predicted N-formylglutamate amidohydrolase